VPLPLEKHGHINMYALFIDLLGWGNGARECERECRAAGCRFLTVGT